MSEPKVITFEEWLKQQEEADGIDLKCGDCDGSGVCRCHCGDEHDCGICDGTGKSGDGKDLQAKYRKAVDADLKRWNEWNKINLKKAA